jgi:cardiolipin synthase
MVNLAVPLLIVNVICAVFIVFVERKNPTAALAWLMVLFFLPLLGLLLYLIFGQNYTREKMFVLKEEDDITLRKTFEEQKELFLNSDLQSSDPRYRRFRPMAYMLLQNNHAFLSGDNDVEVFTDGSEKFEALFGAIREARHHVHLEYFIINNDDLGRRVIAALAEKAREGIEVRLLFDAMGTRAGGGSTRAFSELSDAGGEMAVFFPSLYRVNYRNHRKIAVIDGTTGFIGGFNIGDEYLGTGPLGYWRDTAVKITGSAAAMLQLRFFLDWNYAAKVYLGSDPVYFPPAESSGKTAVQIVSGGPDTRANPIKEGFVKLINTASESVYIQTPYFVPDDAVTDALRIAALSGVDVRIMIPCKPDHPFIYWATLSFIGDLLDSGVRAYTYDNGFIHAKTIVVDGLTASVGSANWDVRSFKLNFEANAFMYDAAVAEELKNAFERDLSVCTEITPERYAARPRWVKAKESVSRLFSPLG